MLDGNVSLNAQSYWIDLAQHIIMNLGGWSLFAVPKVPKVPNFLKKSINLCTIDSLAHLTHI